MKISVIIPIYKTEQFLTECIDSVINQTYTNLEIILVNDGSPGNAHDICKKYTESDPRIRYFSKENEGAAIARNFGIDKATGEYIYCLDSDDTIGSTFMEELHNSITKNNCDLLVLCHEFFSKEYIGALPTFKTVVKKEFLDKYPDVRFQPKMQPCEDGLFSHKILALTDNVSTCNNVVYNYRNNPNSCEHLIEKQKILEYIPKWYDILEEFYNKYNLWDKKLHLLAFINNEPFRLRFRKMKFSNSEKIQIFNVTHKFITKHNLDTIDDEMIKKFSDNFYYFVKSSSYYEYQIKRFFLEKILKKLSFLNKKRG